MYTRKPCEWCGEIFLAMNAKLKIGRARCCSMSCAGHLRQKEYKQKMRNRK